jgi:hypothetical protein
MIMGLSKIRVGKTETLIAFKTDNNDGRLYEKVSIRLASSASDSCLQVRFFSLSL